jgi:hypothetical protein
MIVISFRVIVCFVSCFSAQLERLFQEWMTGKRTARLQICFEDFLLEERAGIIL